jgi:signal peptidase I
MNNTEVKIQTHEKNHDNGYDPCEEEKERPPNSLSVLKALGGLILKIFIVIAVVLLLFMFVFGISRYADNSMSPAIKDGDLVLYYRLDKDYTASECIIVKDDDELEVRRVIAVEGDEVDINENGLYINGSLQQENNIYEDTQRYDTDVEFPLVVEEGQVFVLGDKRQNATDSRVYGTVDIKKDTQGKVITVIRRRGF